MGGELYKASHFCMESCDVSDVIQKFHGQLRIRTILAGCLVSSGPIRAACFHSVCGGIVALDGPRKQPHLGAVTQYLLAYNCRSSAGIHLTTIARAATVHPLNACGEILARVLDDLTMKGVACTAVCESYVQHSTAVCCDRRS
jgi:hypothetical protein